MEYINAEVKYCPKCGSDETDVSVSVQKGLFSKNLPVILLLCDKCEFDAAICNLGD